MFIINIASDKIRELKYSLSSKFDDKIYTNLLDLINSTEGNDLVSYCESILTLIPRNPDCIIKTCKFYVSLLEKNSGEIFNSIVKIIVRLLREFDITVCKNQLSILFLEITRTILNNDQLKEIREILELNDPKMFSVKFEEVHKADPFFKRNHISRYLFVKGINSKYTRSFILNMLQKYGEMKKNYLIYDPEPKYDEAHAFANYDEIEPAVQALQDLNGKFIEGHYWGLQYSSGEKSRYIELYCDTELDVDQILRKLGEKTQILDHFVLRGGKTLVIELITIHEAMKLLRMIDGSDEFEGYKVLCNFFPFKQVSPSHWHSKPKDLDFSKLSPQRSPLRKRRKRLVRDYTRSNHKDDNRYPPRYGIQHKYPIPGSYHQAKVIRVQPVESERESQDILRYVERFGKFERYSYVEKYKFMEIRHINDDKDSLNKAFDGLSHYTTISQNKLVPAYFPLSRSSRRGSRYTGHRGESPSSSSKSRSHSRKRDDLINPHKKMDNKYETLDRSYKRNIGNNNNNNQPERKYYSQRLSGSDNRYGVDDTKKYSSQKKDKYRKSLDSDNKDRSSSRSRSSDSTSNDDSAVPHSRKFNKYKDNK